MKMDLLIIHSPWLLNEASSSGFSSSVILIKDYFYSLSSNGLLSLN